jgi:hypothetical protein
MQQRFYPAGAELFHYSRLVMIGGFISDIHGIADIGQRFSRRPLRKEKGLALGELRRFGIVTVTLI